MTFKLISGAILCAIAFTAAQAKADNHPADSNGFTVVKYFDLDLTAEAQHTFDGEFKYWGFYGAFAMTRTASDNIWGWSSGKSEIGFARERALQFCNQSLEEFGGNGPCEIYAEILPSGQAPAYSFGGATVSQFGSEGYDGFFAYSGHPFKAFAFSKNGAWAWESSGVSTADAEEKALRACDRYARETEDEYVSCRLAR